VDVDNRRVARKPYDRLVQLLVIVEILQATFCLVPLLDLNYDDNLYEMTDAERLDRGIEFLPQTLQEAVAVFAADPLIEATLGKELRDEFIKYKTIEWESYHLSVSKWEIEQYSHLF
jgi:hypothetical protein